MIYKKLESASAEEILETLSFRELPTHGYLFSMDAFIENMLRGCLSDSSGVGELVIDGKVVCNSMSLMQHACFTVGDVYVLSLRGLRDVFGDRVKVVWYSVFENYPTMGDGISVLTQERRMGKVVKLHPSQGEKDEQVV